ncbi:DGQHR domain-containing protein [uncultured Polaribacter sp.]|uniref:DGQHR domain-containing protein n=1 Tax=uncultured Polaribacter sp. TaxID=174711 RepID=UPI00263910A9|nr:DGQHR domain-containing protein [uncultured Polaribacter sp.]
MPELKKINCSWTKFDVVQVIKIAAEDKLKQIYESKEDINASVLKSFVGVDSLEDEFPEYWIKMKNYPKQLRIFALMSAIFTHEKNIKDFANKFTDGKMRGVLIVVPGNKQSTNLRRGLIVSGASLQNYEKAKEVPYDLSALFEEGEVGLLFRKLLEQRILKIGHTFEDIDTQNKFLKVCYNYQFHKVLSLTRDQFKKWLGGQSLNQEEDIFNFSQLKVYKKIPMIKMNQWLNEWDDVNYNTEELRRKPQPVAYLFSIDARVLKKLADVHRRKADKPREEDKHVQRNLNESRVDEINSYIEGGFPWSTLSASEKISYENQKLKMPGFLPTAIIANIIGPGEKRNSRIINDADLLKISDEKTGSATLNIPEQVFSGDWNPELKPIEIIDGQHRLWAFDEDDPLSGNFELPVVAYYNLDRAWQAYLFYTINIKPVKINTSLGYDLYPLLRTQEWLENSKEGLLAYRETRSQEMVEALWNYPESPWFHRINMIGESGGPTMSQAAFIRTLSNSFFKKRDGLFSSNLTNNEVLPWSRTQQAAFLILLWTEFANAVSDSNSQWVEAIRSEDRQLNIYEESAKWDIGFLSKNSFLSRDQGVRGFSTFANDFFFIAASYNDFDFDDFDYQEDDNKSITKEEVSLAIDYFKSQKIDIYNLMKEFCVIASGVDWRTPSANFSNEDEKTSQMRFRGSGGYSQFWKVLLEEFKKSKDSNIQKYVSQLDS